jgi:hypothetical protein
MAFTRLNTWSDPSPNLGAMDWNIMPRCQIIHTVIPPPGVDPRVEPANLWLQ